MNLLEKTIAACNAINFKFDSIGINCVYLDNKQMFSPALYSNDALKLLIQARTLQKVERIQLNLYDNHLTITVRLYVLDDDVLLSDAFLSDNIADDIRQAIIAACIKLGEILNVPK